MFIAEVLYRDLMTAVSLYDDDEGAIDVQNYANKAPYYTTDLVVVPDHEIEEALDCDSVADGLTNVLERLFERNQNLEDHSTPHGDRSMQVGDIITIWGVETGFGSSFLCVGAGWKAIRKVSG